MAQAASGGGAGGDLQRPEAGAAGPSSSTDIGGESGLPGPALAPAKSDVFAAGLLLSAGSLQAAVASGLAERLGKLQKAGLQWLYGVYHGAHCAGYRGGILGDGMGMGKTVQTLVLVHTLLCARQVCCTSPSLPRPWIPPGLALGRPPPSFWPTNALLLNLSSPQRDRPCAARSPGKRALPNRPAPPTSLRSHAAARRGSLVHFSARDGASAHTPSPCR